RVKLYYQEVQDKRYGTSTRDAVLDYKNDRWIVNKSYQDRPDNIVGIMTIKRMDKEMVEKEGQYPEMIETARARAFGRCFIAQQRLTNPPNDLIRHRARMAAENIFNLQNPDMNDIGATIAEMQKWLLPGFFQTAHAARDDKRCSQFAAFVVNNRPPIRLCLRFFKTSDEQRIRTLIHESAHLTGIGESDGEAYYSRYNCLNEDPMIITGNPGDGRRIAQADTWS